ncbi:MAG: N-acetylneuraminate synthase [bacterium]
MPAAFVIAEAGVNHNGSVARALSMVDAAADAGADAVKFQTFTAERLVTQDAPKAAYQVEALDSGESQYQMLARLELSAEDHDVLRVRCDERGIEFMSAAFDVLSRRFLSGLGIRRVKVPSGELTNIPYLREVAVLGLPVLLSTGMATLDEVREALFVLEGAGLSRREITVLQCTTEYPTPSADVNLLAMITMRDEFGVRIGYSDHTSGIEIPVAAVALGAAVIEKHFTLDRTLPGPDHRASLEPGEFAEMVRAIRSVEAALGDGVKRPSAAESANADVARKSIMAATDIASGELMTVENLTVKRPGTGLSPLKWDVIVGRTASRAYRRDDLIEEA